MAKYFKESEYACKCGCGRADLSCDMLERLDAIRELLGRPVIINSGYRCPEHNKKIGGTPESSHMLGYAVDIKAASSREKYEIISAAMKLEINRIGVYSNFIHIDINPTKDNNVIWYGGK